MRNKNLWFICGLALVLSVMFTPKVSATKFPSQEDKDGNCNDNCIIYNQVTIYCFAGQGTCTQTTCITGIC